MREDFFLEEVKMTPVFKEWMGFESMAIMKKGIPIKAKNRFLATVRNGFGTRKTYFHMPQSKINVFKD